MYRNRRQRAAQFNATIVSGEKQIDDTGAGAYAEDEIIMPKTEIPSLVPSLIGIEIRMPSPVTGTVANGNFFKWHLSTKSQDAVIDLSDMDCIECGEQTYELNTAVGVRFHENIIRLTFPAPIPITSAKLYFGVHCDFGESATAKVQYRLLLAPRSIPGVVQQNNLTQSVQF